MQHARLHRNVLDLGFLRGLFTELRLKVLDVVTQMQGLNGGVGDNTFLGWRFCKSGLRGLGVRGLQILSRRLLIFQHK